MFKIDANDLVLVDGYIAVIPGRPNDSIVRTEKKYDRHAVGKVITAAKQTITGDIITLHLPGDIVFYDDSNAVETEMVVAGKDEKVEIIKLTDIVGYQKKGQE
jgi:hypothetical protein